MTMMHSPRTEAMSKVEGSLVHQHLNPEAARRCMAIFWLKTQPQNHTALPMLEQLQGVQTVRIMREQPTLMMVEYCSQQIRTPELVAAMDRHGSCMRQSGC
ncbi:MAG: hypothetical protein R3E95_12085 [Thiolinea sp.]